MSALSKLAKERRKLILKWRRFLNPLAITVDHIIPLSKDGEHSYKNTQLACFKCNCLKGNRGIDGGEQLLLFG
ncbi:MAG: HNH endonuclease [Candidatus Omnitrophica bacterium]|nr:HNH endonuclease [Candidatus Omnitrophota bacterium]